MVRGPKELIIIEKKDQFNYLIMAQNTSGNGLLGHTQEKEKAFRNGLMVQFMKAGG
jgi:hypothetical protein